MSEPIINKVAESGLVTIDLENYYPREETAVFDLKDHLFSGYAIRTACHAIYFQKTRLVLNH